MVYKTHLSIIWLVVTLFLVSCENADEDIRAFTAKKTGVDEAGNIETYFSQDGKVKAKLTSPLMLRYQSDSARIDFPESLHVDFFNDSLEIESVVDALFGSYLENKRMLLLQDSVVIIQRLNGDTLRCEDLWWDQNKESFYTDKPVKVTKKDGSFIPAKGLKATQDFKDIELLHPFDAILPVSESAFTGPQADSTLTTTDSTSQATPQQNDSNP